ncbi:hypothetical protein MIZ03_0799 [Rhodoferax lithotrophicus]|uniref:Uncharacterized protein n=1 Tax=Rhodoferax lithotrophicus TaxID=2798804 RepID=A0ABM7MIA9_9BURK|nr:hypothetical protein MIZ03_0799 [Rhodoferax sp. MIZ03]
MRDRLNNAQTARIRSACALQVCAFCRALVSPLSAYVHGF